MMRSRLIRVRALPCSRHANCVRRRHHTRLCASGGRMRGRRGEWTPKGGLDMQSQTTPHLRWGYLLGGIVGIVIAGVGAVASTSNSSHSPSILGIGLLSLAIIVGSLMAVFGIARFVLDVIATRGHRGQSETLHRPEV